MTAALCLKVDGEECKDISLNFPIVDGLIGAKPQVIVWDNPDKPYALQDRFLIELKEGEEDWRQVSVIYLTTLILLLTTEQPAPTSPLSDEAVT